MAVRLDSRPVSGKKLAPGKRSNAMSRLSLSATVLICLSILFPGGALGQATLLADFDGPDGFGNGSLNASDDGWFVSEGMRPSV